ncbi:S8 family serine peptidase [Streptomyces sp. NPDC008313]|uniref:S8 family serine peptidase n=1 Tax=Streptomyces sp. NPDC008313 TaxID=3364826 RepID=UPI0036E40F0E
MEADNLWKVSTGKGVKVAVIDSGVNPDTPSLRGQVLVDEVPKKVSYHVTEDYAGHGTSVAELIAGTGAGSGIRGLAPGAKIVPYRIVTTGLKNKAEKRKSPSLDAVIRAVADSDVKIINMSFGRDFVDPDEKAAIAYAASKGKLMFASVGNDAQKKNFIGYPAAYPRVVGVSAADDEGTVGKFSESGAYVDLAAPGLDVPFWCDATFQSHCQDNGTSAASAITSATAALIWSAHPDWTANQVLRVMIDTAGRDWPKDRPSKYLGYGLIRPGQVLLDGKGKPGAADVDPLTDEKTPGAAGAGDASPSTSASHSPKPSKDAAGSQVAAESSAQSSDDNDDTMWWALGGVAAVVLIGGAAFAVVRSRRGA